MRNRSDSGLRTRQALRIYWAQYAKYVTRHVLLTPILAARGIFRAERRRYRQILWRRLVPLHFLAAPKGCHVIYGLGIGESAKAARFLQVLQKARNLQGIIVTETADASSAHFADVKVFPAPFNNPLSVLIALVVLRPAAIWSVENLNNQHLKAIAAWLAIPVILFNVQASITDDLSHPEAYWRVRLVELYATQSPEVARLFGSIPGSEIAVAHSGPVAICPPQIEQAAIEPPEVWKQRLALAQQSPIIVAGSTHRADVEVLIPAFRAVKSTFPTAALVIAPRDLRDVAWLQGKLSQDGISCRLRSETTVQTRVDVLILDSIGELRQIYQICDVAFTGGTFEPNAGGHSMAEAVAWGKMNTCGPYFTQQQGAANQLIDFGLLEVCNSPADLADAWARHLGSGSGSDDTQQSFTEFQTADQESILKFFDQTLVDLSGKI